MQALDPRPTGSGGSKRSLVALALLAPLAAGLAAAGGGSALLVGVLIPLGVLGVLAFATTRRSAGRGKALFTWQQVHMGMERELRRSLRRQRWRRRLHLGMPTAGTRGTVDEKTSA